MDARVFTAVDDSLGDTSGLSSIGRGAALDRLSELAASGAYDPGLELGTG
jgi:hypothetical protein